MDSYQYPDKSRSQYYFRRVSYGIRNFFYGDLSDDDEIKWTSRRMQHCLKFCGDIDVDKLLESDLKEITNQSQLNMEPSTQPFDYRIRTSQIGRRHTMKSYRSFRRVGNMGPLPRSFHTDSEIDNVLQRKVRRSSAIQVTYSKVKKLVKNKSSHDREYKVEEEQNLRLNDDIELKELNIKEPASMIASQEENLQRSLDVIAVDSQHYSSPRTAASEDQMDTFSIATYTTNQSSERAATHSSNKKSIRRKAFAIRPSKSFTLPRDRQLQREYGKGIVGKALNRTLRRERLSSSLYKKFDKLDNHRPYFTYWVSTVQVIVLIVSLALHGFAPVGFNRTKFTAFIQRADGTKEEVSFYENDNFWIGPRQNDLIHLGAMFSPCMRSDVKITQTISLDRQEENRTGCCISLDKSGCVQRSRLQCSETFSLFHKWSATKPSSTSRTSGPVCGEDPRTCKVPASVKPFQWPDDITKWPSCSRMLSVNYSRERMPHMTCRVLGRPCCIGRFGKCEIVSAEYCNYRRGTYHRNAFLCSQVNCLESSCGLVKFLNPTVPDQFYRFWISLFLHAGLLHLGVTLLFNLIILKDFEKMAGWLRISIIYVLSGIGGNIISGILLPYHPEIGPSGSNFGIVACLFVEVFQSWQILKRPVRAIGKLAVIVLVLFVFGLLPYVDNFSHFGGFIFGLFLAFAILPYVSFGKWDRRRKRLQIIISIFIVGGLFCAILFIFYRGRPFECKVCRYLNCIPFTDHFCKNLGQKLELF